MGRSEGVNSSIRDKNKGGSPVDFYVKKSIKNSIFSKKIKQKRSKNRLKKLER